MSYLEAASAGTIEQIPAQPSRGFRVLRRLMRRPVAVIAIAVIVTVYTAGIFAPLVAPYGFNQTDFEDRFGGPSASHILGTDRLGRDLFSRLIWSAQTTVIISVFTVVSGGLVLGVSAGLLSGYLGGRTDTAIMRTGDLIASVPTILLLLILNATMLEPVENAFAHIGDVTGIDFVRSGIPNYFLVFGSLSLFGWVALARLVRSQTLALREADYAFAARAIGATTPRILFKHILPNMTNLLVVGLTLSLGAVAAAEIGLSFIGVGIRSPHPSFGVMVSDYAGVSNIRTHFNLILWPALVIGALIFAFNLLGDALTDVLSPRRR